MNMNETILFLCHGYDSFSRHIKEIVTKLHKLTLFDMTCMTIHVSTTSINNVHMTIAFRYTHKNMILGLRYTAQQKKHVRF